MRRRLVPPPSWPRVVGAWALLLPGVVAFRNLADVEAMLARASVGLSLIHISEPTRPY